MGCGGVGCRGEGDRNLKNGDLGSMKSKFLELGTFFKSGNIGQRRVKVIVHSIHDKLFTQLFSLNRPHWADSIIESLFPFMCVLGVCAIGCSFFLGLSLVLRSHDQFQTSHWSSHPHHSPHQKKIVYTPSLTKNF